jgi:hypothetical protein
MLKLRGCRDEDKINALSKVLMKRISWYKYRPSVDVNYRRILHPFLVIRRVIHVHRSTNEVFLQLSGYGTFFFMAIKTKQLQNAPNAEKCEVSVTIVTDIHYLFAMNELADFS